MGKLTDKVAQITGGTTGIGAATARLFQAEGARVIVTGANPKTAEAAAADLAGIEVIVSNQGDPAASKALIEAIKATYGRVDVLFVNAGIAHFAPIDHVDEAFFDKPFAINVRGAYFVVKHARPTMPDGSAIILTASTAASSGLPAASVYSATKAAVRSFGRPLAAELAPRAIRVNIISPGPVEAAIFGKTELSGAEIDGFIEGIKAKVPLQRIGQPKEIAEAVLYLAAGATFMTGGEIIAGGGLVDI